MMTRLLWFSTLSSDQPIVTDCEPRDRVPDGGEMEIAGAMVSMGPQGSSVHCAAARPARPAVAARTRSRAAKARFTRRAACMWGPGGGRRMGQDAGPDAAVASRPTGIVAFRDAPHKPDRAAHDRGRATRRASLAEACPLMGGRKEAKVWRERRVSTGRSAARAADERTGRGSPDPRPVLQSPGKGIRQPTRTIPSIFTLGPRARAGAPAAGGTRGSWLARNFACPAAVNRLFSWSAGRARTSRSTVCEPSAR
jgi:hypothetical protein